MILLTFFQLQESTIFVFVFDFHKLLKRRVNGSKIDTLYEIKLSNLKTCMFSWCSQTGSFPTKN